MSEAQAQMRTIAKQLEQAYPDVNKERSIALVSLEAAKSQGLGGPNNEDLARNVSLLLLAHTGICDEKVSLSPICDERLAAVENVVVVFLCYG